MKTQNSTTRCIEALLDMGLSTKAISAKLRCKPQAVYSARYHLNKRRGLGAIGAAPVPTPTAGIGTPPKSKPKRKATRRKQETGIVAAPKPLIDPAQNAYRPAGTWVESPITMIEPPTLWQRVKGWFGG
jgi:hypothetical protein